MSEEVKGMSEEVKGMSEEKICQGIKDELNELTQDFNRNRDLGRVRELNTQSIKNNCSVFKGGSKRRKKSKRSTKKSRKSRRKSRRKH
jgi:hypothetical protein